MSSMQSLRGIPKTVLIWKLGSNSDKDIITLVPLTSPVKRFMDSGFDFQIMPATVVWFAPRYVEIDDNGVPSFTVFNELDPLDKTYVNISIQQVTSVTDSMSPEIHAAYMALLSNELKEPQII